MTKNKRIDGFRADLCCDGGLAKAMVCVKTRKPALAKAFGTIAPFSLFAGVGAMKGSLAYRLLDYLTIESLTEMCEPRGIEFPKPLNVKQYLSNPQPTSYERQGYNKQSKEKKAEDYTGGCDQSDKWNHSQRGDGESHRGTQANERFVLRRRRLDRDCQGSAGSHSFPTQVGATDGTAAESGYGAGLGIWRHQYAKFPMSVFYRWSDWLNIQSRRVG